MYELVLILRGEYEYTSIRVLVGIGLISSDGRRDIYDKMITILACDFIAVRLENNSIVSE